VFVFADSRTLTEQVATEMGSAFGLPVFGTVGQAGQAVQAALTALAVPDGPVAVYAMPSVPCDCTMHSPLDGGLAQLIAAGGVVMRVRRGLYTALEGAFMDALKLHHDGVVLTGTGVDTGRLASRSAFSLRAVGGFGGGSVSCPRAETASWLELWRHYDASWEECSVAFPGVIALDWDNWQKQPLCAASKLGRMLDRPVNSTFLRDVAPLSRTGAGAGAGAATRFTEDDVWAIEKARRQPMQMAQNTPLGTRVWWSTDDRMIAPELINDQLFHPYRHVNLTTPLLLQQGLLPNFYWKFSGIWRDGAQWKLDFLPSGSNAPILFHMKFNGAHMVFTSKDNQEWAPEKMHASPIKNVQQSRIARAGRQPARPFFVEVSVQARDLRTLIVRYSGIHGQPNAMITYAFVLRHTKATAADIRRVSLNPHDSDLDALRVQYDAVAMPRMEKAQWSQMKEARPLWDAVAPQPPGARQPDDPVQQTTAQVAAANKKNQSDLSSYLEPAVDAGVPNVYLFSHPHSGTDMTMDFIAGSFGMEVQEEDGFGMPEIRGGLVYKMGHRLCDCGLDHKQMAALQRTGKVVYVKRQVPDVIVDMFNFHQEGQREGLTMSVFPRRSPPDDRHWGMQVIPLTRSSLHSCICHWVSQHPQPLLISKSLTVVVPLRQNQNWRDDVPAFTDVRVLKRLRGGMYRPLIKSNAHACAGDLQNGLMPALVHLSRVAYWRHHVASWEACAEKYGNILVLDYEDVQLRPRRTIAALSRFLGVRASSVRVPVQVDGNNQVRVDIRQ
jgi:hypothetical protein